MKILFCSNSLRTFLIFRRDVVSYFLKEKGYEVVIVAPEDRRPDPEMGNNTFKFIPIRMSRGGMNPFSDFRLFLQLMKIYKKEKPDLIFHYTIKPNIYGVLAAKIRNVPATAMITGLGYAFQHNDMKSKVARMLFKTALKIPERVFVLNQEIYDYVKHNNILPQERVVLLPGGEGVNLEKFK